MKYHRYCYDLTFGLLFTFNLRRHALRYFRVNQGQRRQMNHRTLLALQKPKKNESDLFLDFIRAICLYRTLTHTQKNCLEKVLTGGAEWESPIYSSYTVKLNKRRKNFCSYEMTKQLQLFPYFFIRFFLLIPNPRAKEEKPLKYGECITIFNHDHQK